MVLRDFLVFIERYHLVQELLSHMVQWCQLEGCDANFDIRQLSNDGLHLAVFNTVQWLDDL